MKTITLSHSVVKLRHDMIIEVETNSNHLYTVDDVKENVGAIGKLSGYKKMPVLIIGGALTDVTKEARNYMASEESLKYSIAEAFVINSLSQKILVNFYIKFDKPLVPTKCFTDKELAIEWLKGYIISPL